MSTGTCVLPANQRFWRAKKREVSGGEAADDAVLLRRHPHPGLCQRLDHRLGGERLDDRDVDHLGLDAVLAGQGLGRPASAAPQLKKRSGTSCRTSQEPVDTFHGVWRSRRTLPLNGNGDCSMRTHRDALKTARAALSGG